jgi:hypothetical protein
MINKHETKRIETLEDELHSVIHAAEVLIRALESVPRNYPFDPYIGLIRAIKYAKERAL